MIYNNPDTIVSGFLISYNISMTVIINKAISSNSVVLTLTESTTIENPFYLMKLQAEFSNRIFRISLGTNVSVNYDRYDEFMLDSETIAPLPSGKYFFEVFQFEQEVESEQSSDTSIECGYLIVSSDNAVVTYSELPTNHTDIEYKVLV